MALAGVAFVAHMLVAGNYGYFRDELYYLADGQHLQLGYVDQPLLMGWLAALLRVTAGMHVFTPTVGLLPLGIAFAGANIWVTNYYDNTVSRLADPVAPPRRYVYLPLVRR